MMYAGGMDARDRYEAIERRERRRHRWRRIVFDTVGFVLIVLVFVVAW